MSNPLTEQTTTYHKFIASSLGLFNVFNRLNLERFEGSGIITLKATKGEIAFLDISEVKLFVEIREPFEYEIEVRHLRNLMLVCKHIPEQPLVIMLRKDSYSGWITIANIEV